MAITSLLTVIILVSDLFGHLFQVIWFRSIGFFALFRNHLVIMI